MYNKLSAITWEAAALSKLTIISISLPMWRKYIVWIVGQLRLQVILLATAEITNITLLFLTKNIF